MPRWSLVAGLGLLCGACSVDTVLGSSLSDASLDAAQGSIAGRVPGAVLAYDFSAGSGDRVFDRAGVEPALDLIVAEPEQVRWGATGLRVVGPTLIAQPAEQDSGRVTEACRDSGAVTLEAWVTPGLAEQPPPGEQSPARIVGISLDPQLQNVQLGQLQQRYRGRVWTDCSGCGNNAFVVFTGEGSTREQPTHLVVTRGDDGQLRMFQDGSQTESRSLEGSLQVWDSSHRIALAGEHDAGRHWLGDYHWVALYCRALSSEEIGRNYDAGY